MNFEKPRQDKMEGAEPSPFADLEVSDLEPDLWRLLLLPFILLGFMFSSLCKSLFYVGKK